MHCCVVHDLCLDIVLATEHVVDVGEVVGAGDKSLSLAGGLEVLLQVGVLTEQAKLEAISYGPREY
jgi:hypothetical protein